MGSLRLATERNSRILKMTHAVAFLLLTLTFSGLCGGQETQEAETAPLFKSIRLPILNIGIAKPTFRKTVVRKDVNNGPAPPLTPPVYVSPSGSQTLLAT